ncbi:hypothetical protein ABC974_06200 [Sphingomonas oligophenolica]|uniref:Lipoprotein n=1 Tax=Sphingomonas oligophenolica TaxID=301154 RepID=A0ABU9Y059_9SPHN
MRRVTIVLAMLLAGFAVSACRYGHPGHDSDRHGHHHGHDRPYR